LDVVTKQFLSFAILRKEKEEDLPEFEFGTLTTSCQTLEKRKMGRKHGIGYGYIPAAAQKIKFTKYMRIKATPIAT